jgi:DNA polymerase-3 subunit epsilon
MRQQALAQLSLDGADRLVDVLTERRAPLPLAEAARCLFALRQAPSALVRQLVDEVVRTDPRLAWRSAGEVALSAWEEVGSLTELTLEDAPFVVFDLETTGTRPGTSRIVEVGAVRMLGFEAVATFERLVNPGFPVPETITRITGIQTRDVRGAARIDRVLPEFLRFAGGAVLVAHNARFDVGFVDAELARLHGRRLAAPVIDTVALARRLLAGRVSRMNLATLAERFDTRVRPCHRALADAEATAEVLACLLGMAQEQGVRTVADAVAFAAPARRPARARRALARDVPPGPGVYLFRDGHEQVLYVGKATDLRARVRSYFSGPALRRPVEHALAATERIEARPLGSELEAALVELELIQRLRPPANSRGVHPERCCYLTLTVSEPAPRLAVTKEPAPGEVSAGPFRSRGEAQTVAAALRTAFGVRTCRAARPADDDRSCLSGLLGSCHAPCRGGRAAQRYAAGVAAARGWLERGEGEQPLVVMRKRMSALRDQQRYEEAASVRDGLDALDRATRTLARLRRIAGRSGVLLTPDSDDRFVQAFACARGRVVARRRLPRAGDGRLEIAPLLLAIDAATVGPVRPFLPIEADQGRVVAAAFARPGVTVQAVPITDGDVAGQVARRRARVPLRG